MWQSWASGIAVIVGLRALGSNGLRLWRSPHAPVPHRNTQDQTPNGGIRPGLISAWIFYFCTVWRRHRPAWRTSTLRRASPIGLAGVRHRSVALVALLTAGLAGCESASDRIGAGAFTSPGKYNVYTCEDIDRQIRGIQARQTELEQVMGRAAQSAGGDFVNTIAYRGEYAQGRGELAELAKAKSDKQCAVDSKFSSGRAVF